LFVNDNIKCVEGASEGQYPEHDSNCGVLSTQPNGACWQTGADGPHTALEAGAGAETDVDAALKRAAWEKRVAALSGCYPTESWANNFIALRSMPGSEFGDTLYAEFQTAPKAQTVFDKPDFYEYYDNAKDKWQMDNLYNSTDGATLKALAAKLHAFYDCSGDNCP